MKIKREMLMRQQQIEGFAEEHDLTMKVVERSKPINESLRFYAKFEYAEIKEGIILSSVFGNGDTVDKAITEYARKISEKTMVICAYSSDRKEIKVPLMIYALGRDLIG